ncbi:MAG: alpha/beta hydrolase fold domain-containing protein, partial [Desulfobacteraceae bacterium]|nr:alpha/beta hydrolase fold domain-containing protein [Desulfobacteraceae bacterium]
RRFFNSGYSVFRLNMRDHGESHHLNKGMFYSTLLDEVFDAVSFISSMEKEGPVFFVGFSLGGNFGMRIARKCSEKPVDNLKHIVCISPVLDPNKATIKIDDHFLIKKYFLRKWRRSLKKKQALYPDIYDFSDLFPINTIMGLTDLLLKRYSEYSNIQEYFKGYTLINDAVKNISVPTTMIISKDDPIIPIEDFHSLKTNSLTNLLIHEYGGHNGFIEGYLLRSWYERYMVRLFGQYQA